MTGKVLIVDDERNITLVVQAMLEKEGIAVLAFNDSAKALLTLDAPENAESIDAIVTDLYMPGKGGMEILAHCRREHPRLPVVLITAFGTVETAVSALKMGAFDFITKPFEQSELLSVVKKAIATHREARKEPARSEAAVSTIIGASAPIQEVFKVIGKVAASPSSVLIYGESGTGKELVAAEIHRNSPRAKRPFIKVNCAAIPSTLIESELFGHEKGAFTGAVASKPGRFELAHEGSLFLDEVAEMPQEMQVKLLRALQEHEFERVGGINTIQVDVRIIAATNRDPEQLVKEGKFREDLFYRLNVVPIRIPPLRDRPEDIEPLARHLIAELNKRLAKRVSSLDRECLLALLAYSWPGNIRQLENVLERMILMSEGEILRASDLPPEIAAAANAESLAGDGSGNFKDIVRKQTQSVERDLIERALEENGGNVTKTAEKLGLSRKGLQIKMKELGIRAPRGG